MTQKKLPWLLFGAYVLLLAWSVLLKLGFGGGLLELGRSVVLIPFHFDEIHRWYTMLLQALLNTVIFLPLGIYLRLLGASTKTAILTGLGLSLAFEVIQYVLAIGISDITDLIANTAGAALGALCYPLLPKKRLLQAATVLTALALITFLTLLIRHIVSV